MTIRFGCASIGTDNRPFAGGSAAALAHSERTVEEALKDEPGVTLAWSFFKGAGPAVNEAFANGQLDFAFQGDLPSVIGRASGLKTKIVLATGAHAPLYLAVPPGSSIASVKDLKGKKVSIFRGTNNHLAAVKVLAANGLTARDLSVLDMDVATTNAALASGDIDAAFGNFGLIAFLVEQYRVQARQDRAYGLIRRDVDVTGWFEPRYLDRALRELGLETHWPRLGPDGKPLS